MFIVLNALGCHQMSYYCDEYFYIFFFVRIIFIFSISCFNRNSFFSLATVSFHFILCNEKNRTVKECFFPSFKIRCEYFNKTNAAFMSFHILYIWIPCEWRWMPKKSCLCIEMEKTQRPFFSFWFASWLLILWIVNGCWVFKDMCMIYNTKSIWNFNVMHRM